MINLDVHELPYSDDLILSYDHFHDLPGFVLLDSSRCPQGRYDILSAFPYDEFKQAYSSDSLNDVFKSLQERLRVEPSDAVFPFQGGAIGYVTYDFGAKLMGIEKPPHPMLDNFPALHFRWYDWAIISDHKLKKVHLIASHHDSNTRALIPELKRRWFAPVKVTSAFEQGAKDIQCLMSREAYARAFQAIHADLVRGRAYQVNLTQPFLCEYHGHPWSIYKQLRHHNPTPYAAFFSDDPFAIISCSPERFLRHQGGVIVTSPIKGTIQRSNVKSIDDAWREQLHRCEKNRAENVMIVDLMRNDLAKVADKGSVRVTGLCQIESYQAVHHMVSHVEATLHPSRHPFDAFSACFPGGSITGAPKLEAMRMIAEHEAYGRGLYCGSVGYFSNHGVFDTNIAIRTMIANDNTLYLAAGGGIVINSLLEQEYQECFTKIAAIQQGLTGHHLDGRQGSFESGS